MCLGESTASPHVERWDDRPGRVELDGYRAGIGQRLDDVLTLRVHGLRPPATYLVYDVHGIAQMRDTHTGDD